MFTVDLNLGGADRLFRNLVRAGGDLRPVFRAIRKDVKQDLQEHFARQQGPNGSWPARDPDTVARIIGKRGLIQRGKRKGQFTKRSQRRVANQLGRLKYAWRYDYNRQALTASNLVPWAIVHQEGGAAGRSKIPARPFAWASPPLVGIFRSAVLRHLHGAAR